MEDAYDFYKPNLESEYPIVDGKLSITCYLRALDSCYTGFRQRLQRATKGSRLPSLDDIDFACFHSPYTKLVMRSYARLLYNDAKSTPATDSRFAWLTQALRGLTEEQSYTDKELTKVTDTVSKAGYETKVAPGQLLSQELGNTYCGSLYCNLLSLISNKSEAEVLNKRVMMFSYGSGLAATMFALRVRRGGLASPSVIAAKTSVKNRLAQRTAVAPSVFTDVLSLRERTHSAAGYQPVGGSQVPLFPGTFHLQNIDALKRRTYARVN